MCFSYTTEKGTVIILDDRKKEFIGKNMSICDSICDLSEYNQKTNMSKCECEVKIKIPLINEIILDKQKFFKKFKNIKNIMNIKVLKCYKKLFTSKGLKNNIGSYILILMIFFNIICAFLFIFKGFNYLYNIVNKIASLNLNKSNNKNKNINRTNDGNNN